MHPSVETIIKETFNISRVRLLDTQKQIGKNKVLTRFSSIYFNVDLKKHKIDLKASYKYQRGFQEKIGNQQKKEYTNYFLKKQSDNLEMVMTVNLISFGNLQDMI